MFNFVGCKAFILFIEVFVLSVSYTQQSAELVTAQEHAHRMQQKLANASKDGTVTLVLLTSHAYSMISLSGGSDMGLNSAPFLYQPRETQPDCQLSYRV